MKKIDRVLKQLSDLYEFNRKISAYELRKKEKANRLNKSPPAPLLQKGGDSGLS